MIHNNNMRKKILKIDKQAITRKQTIKLTREAQASSQCLLIPFKFIVRGNKLALIKRFSQNNVLKLSKLSCTQDQKLCLDYKKYLMTK